MQQNSHKAAGRRHPVCSATLAVPSVMRSMSLTYCMTLPTVPSRTLSSNTQRLVYHHQAHHLHPLQTQLLLTIPDWFFFVYNWDTLDAAISHVDANLTHDVQLGSVFLLSHMSIKSGIPNCNNISVLCNVNQSASYTLVS